MDEKGQNILEIKDWLVNGFSYKDDKFYREYMLYLLIDHRFNRNGSEILYSSYPVFREKLVNRLSQEECVQLRNLEDSYNRFIDTGDLEIYKNDIWSDAVNAGFVPNSYINDIFGSIVVAKNAEMLGYVVKMGSLGKVDAANNGYVSFPFIINILYKKYNLILDVSRVYRLRQWFKLMKEECNKIGLQSVGLHITDPTLRRIGLVAYKVRPENLDVDNVKYPKLKEYFSNGCTFKKDVGYLDWVMYTIAHGITFEERKILTMEEYNNFCCGKTVIMSKEMYRRLEHADLVLREFIERGDIDRLLSEIEPIKITGSSKLQNRVKEISISQLVDCMFNIVFKSATILEISKICDDLLDTDYGYALFVILVEKLYRDCDLVFNTKTFVGFQVFYQRYEVCLKNKENIESQKLALRLQDKFSSMNPYDQVVFRVKEYLAAGTQLKSVDNAYNSLNSIYGRILSGDENICNYIDDMLNLFYVATCNIDMNHFGIYMFVCSSATEWDWFNNNNKFDKVEDNNLVVALNWYLNCVFKTIEERYGYSIGKMKDSLNGLALITKGVDSNILNKLFGGKIDSTELEIDYGYFKLNNTKYGELTITGMMYEDDKELIGKIGGVHDLDTHRQVTLFDNLSKLRVGTSDYRSCVSKLVSTVINLYALGECCSIEDRTKKIELDKDTKRYLDKFRASGIYSNLLLLDGLKDDEKLGAIDDMLEMNRCFERLEASTHDSVKVSLWKRTYGSLLRYYKEYRPVITGSLMFTLGLISGTSTMAVIELLIVGVVVIYAVNKVDAFYVNMKLKDLSRYENNSNHKGDD